MLTIRQVIGQITYSKRHGFVERNQDIDGMVGYLGRLFSYVAPVRIKDLAEPLQQLTWATYRLDRCHGLTCCS